MDKQIRKLKKIVELHYGQSKIEIENLYGKPRKSSDREVWFYHHYHRGVFKDEIAFFFEEDKVVDIALTEYIFWIEYKNIFYYKGENPEYKVVNLL